MKTSFLIKVVIMNLCLLITTNMVAQKKNKALEGKKYTVQFTEIKKTGKGKGVESLVTIKGGKILSDLMEEKIQLPAIAYKITQDSTFTEDDLSVHLIGFEAEYSEDKNDYRWEGVISNFDIEGTVVQSKNKVEKKRYEFSGSEKTKK